MKGIFSFQLYLAGLKKIKTAGIAAAITVIALNSLVPIVGIIDSTASWPGRVRVVESVSASAFSPFHLLMMVFGVILVHSMFSFMNERNKSDFWHAIPQKRICVYLSFLSAVWSWILAVIVTSSLVNLALWGLAKYYTVSASIFFSSIGVYFLSAVMVSMFVLVAMTITGTTLSNFLVAALLAFFFRIMSTIFVMGLENLAFMLDVSHSFWRILSIEFYLPFALLANLFSSKMGPFSDLPLILFTIFVILLLVAAGAFGYCSRKSETATKSAPNKILQHAYRCAVTLPLIFLLATLIAIGDAEVSTSIILSILALIVWVLFEVMTTKKIKNVLKSLPVLIVPIVVSALLCGGMFISRNIVWSQTPTPEEIEGISVENEMYHDNSYEMLISEKLVVRDDSIKTIVSETLKQNIKDSKTVRTGFNDHFIIHLKSGISMGRYLNMDDKDYYHVRNLLYASDEYRDTVLSLPSNSSLQIWFSGMGQQYAPRMDLWESVKAEYASLDDQEKREIKEYYNANFAREEENGKRLYPVGSVEVTGYVGHKQYRSEYPIFYKYMPQTAQLYLEEKNEENGLFESNSKDDISRMYLLALKAVELQEETSGKEGAMGGSLSLTPLSGNVDIGRVGFSFYEKREEKQLLADILAVMQSLSDPANYSYEKGNNIIYLQVHADLSGEFLLENDLAEFALSEVYPEEYYYVSHEIPLSLTDAEVKQLLSIYDNAPRG